MGLYLFDSSSIPGWISRPGAGSLQHPPGDITGLKLSSKTGTLSAYGKKS
jgi:hypothetical protein